MNKTLTHVQMINIPNKYLRSPKNKIVKQNDEKHFINLYKYIRNVVDIFIKMWQYISFLYNTVSPRAKKPFELKYMQHIVIIY